MNSKKLNIILITAVVVIWGVVIYKYFIQNSGDSINFDSIPIAEKKDFVNHERKDFTLVKLKRDPFLEKVYSKSKTVKPSPVKSRKKIKKTLRNKTKKEFVYTPVIQYLGFIKNKKNSKKMVILKVEGKTQIIKEQTKFKDLFYVKKAHQDSVEIVINKITKIFKKEK